jgi:two-component system cell cycle sensor histidine kinase/response regulator CckA
MGTIESCVVGRTPVENRGTAIAMDARFERHPPAHATPPATATVARRDDAGHPSWLVPVALGAASLGLGYAASLAPQPVPLALLAILATCGLFFLLAAASGRVHIAAAAPPAHERIADNWPDAVLLTTRLGQTVYANAAFETTVPGAPVRGLPALELWVTGQPVASEALFRLVRAGERGEALTEEIDIQDHARGRRSTWRIGVAPLVLGAEAAPLVLWRLSDITREQEGKRARERATAMRLEAYETAPAGLLVLDADHGIVHMNTALEHWLGVTAPVDETMPIALDAVFTPAGADILRRHFVRYPLSSFQCPLDVASRGGRRLAVRVLAGPPEAPDGTRPGSRVLAVVRAEWAEPTALVADPADRSFQRHYQAAPFGIATVTATGRIAGANGAFATIVLDGSGGVDDPALDVLARDASPEVRHTLARYLQDVVAGEVGLPPVDFTADAKGTLARRLYAVPLAAAPGAREAAVLYVVDTTEQRQLEAKFAQSQKMEAIGKLAGEMAHNFNNVLTAIIGSADLMLQTFRVSDPAHKDIQNIRQSAFRAAELVNQLMSFSRQQTLRLEYAHLGDWLSELRPTVRAALGEKIDLQMSVDQSLWYVRADRTQIQQVLMNFASNSRDAMPGGGCFQLRVRNVVERDLRDGAEIGVPTGEYVLIEAQDNGSGMSPEVREKVFEPFYTTKEVGKGTGLGLASVYGIVKQLSGYIVAHSEVGRGTVFRVYLPRAYPDAETEVPALAKPARQPPRPVDLTGSATVLVVEDEDMVRSVAVRQLARLGYRVLEAGNGREALEVIEAEHGIVDIVISDVVMPEMDGPTFLEVVRRTRPDLKIIFVSGHTNDAFRATVGQNETFAFLQKPFTLPQLAQKVKEELGR